MRFIIRFKPRLSFVRTGFVKDFVYRIIVIIINEINDLLSSKYFLNSTELKFPIL
jgi:hypothetical protein